MQQAVRIVALACSIRLLLLLWDVGTYLSWRIEVSTPADSILGVREGVTLQQLGICPYTGSTVRQPPLILSILSPFLGGPGSLTYALPNATWDIGAGLLLRWLVQFLTSLADAQHGQKTGPNSMQQLMLSPDHVMAAYLLNPFLIGASISGSVVPLQNMCTVGVLAAGVAGQRILATAVLAFAVLMAPHTLLLLVPLLMLSMNNPEDIVHAEQPKSIVSGDTPLSVGSPLPPSLAQRTMEWLRHACILLSLVAFWLLIFVFLSDITLGTASQANACIPQLCAFINSYVSSKSSNSNSGRCWIHSVFSLHLLVEDITPNLGQWWYFFSEVFEGYRAFFCFIMLALSVVFSVPTALRFPHRPLALFFLQLATNCLFKPYPSVGDLGLIFSLMPLFQLQLQRIRTGLFLISTFMMLTVLGPAMWHQWIDIESANSNFFYSITLLLGAWQVMFLLQFTICTAEVDRLYLKGSASSNQSVLEGEGSALDGELKDTSLKKEE